MSNPKVFTKAVVVHCFYTLTYTSLEPTPAHIVWKVVKHQKHLQDAR